MGATITVNSARENLEEVVMEATGGRGADVVIDYSGSGIAIAGGLKCLKLGGTMVLVGLPTSRSRSTSWTASYTARRPHRSHRAEDVRHLV